MDVATANPDASSRMTNAKLRSSTALAPALGVASTSVLACHPPAMGPAGEPIRGKTEVHRSVSAQVEVRDATPGQWSANLDAPLSRHVDEPSPTDPETGHPRRSAPRRLGGSSRTAFPEGDPERITCKDANDVEVFQFLDLYDFAASPIAGVVPVSIQRRIWSALWQTKCESRSESMRAGTTPRQRPNTKDGAAWLPRTAPRRTARSRRCEWGGPW
jgi:hypothetical protein